MFEQFLYLSALLVSISCLVLCDFRWKLAFFYDAKRTTKVIAASMLVFIIWDILGIALGIFFGGDSPYTSGIALGPEFPIEELFFLFLLSYVTLGAWRVFEEKCSPIHS